jgi:hypothetical protein
LTGSVYGAYMPRPKRKASALIIHPLVPVAKAAKVLRIEQELLVQKLTAGEILGESRAVENRKGDRKHHKKVDEIESNSWFIYASEFNRLLDERLAQYERRISTDGLDQFFTSPEFRLDAKFRPTLAEPLPAPQPEPETAETPEQIPVLEASELSQAGTEAPAESFFEFAAALEHQHLQEHPEPQEHQELQDEQQQPNIEYHGHEVTLLDVYDSPEQNISTTLDGTKVVAELVQHLRDEIAYRHNLESRIEELASEVAYLRSEIMQKPAAESPLKRLGNYFRLFLRDVKALYQ